MLDWPLLKTRGCPALRHASTPRPHLAHLLWLVSLLSCLCVQSATAHRGSSKRLYIEQLAQGANIEVDLEAVDVAVELGLPEDTPSPEAVQHATEIRRWLSQGIQLFDSQGACAGQAAEIREDTREGIPRIIVTMHFACHGRYAEQRLRDNTIFDTDPQHEAYVHVRWQEHSHAEILRFGRQSLSLGRAPGPESHLTLFFQEGIHHLVTGYDHMLFLFSLLLTAGFISKEKGLRAAFRDVAWVVTAFTLGHSLTLVVAALGWVTLPAKWVEATIAASIALVAFWNIWKPSERRGLPAVAFFFGLIHGFGFSGVLRELGLPQESRVLSLLGFNLGIEMAQLVLVALLLYPLHQLAKSAHYRTKIIPGASMLIGAIALYWCVERLL